MPTLSVWMIRSALLHLAVGWLIGGAILWQKGPGGLPGAWGWLPLHLYLSLVGWMVQLALGVAYWIMPRFARRASEAERFVQVRGREGLAWTGAALLNGSSLVALVGDIAAASALALLAVLAFALHLWARVKPFRVDA